MYSSRRRRLQYTDSISGDPKTKTPSRTISVYILKYIIIIHFIFLIIQCNTHKDIVMCIQTRVRPFSVKTIR